MRVPSLAASSLALVALLAAGAPTLTAAPAHAAATRSCMPSSLQAAPVHAAVTPAYFEMQTVESAAPFVFQLTDPAKIDEACGAFLPGCVFCPWTSRLVREVPAP